GMSLARPVAGQTVTDADGTLTVEPGRAVIAAQAKLNGAAARIDMVEPLGGSSVERSQKIELTLDDAARDRLAPGLSTILSGPATVKLEAIGDDRRKVVMDLKSSVLSIPWVGWSKGRGIPAT